MGFEIAQIDPCDPDTLYAGSVAGLYRSARVGVVTPLRDGMNLVAKEYVAAQSPDDPGVLILSRFAKVLGLLLMSGVPVIRALEITGEVVVNRTYRTFLQGVREELIQGISLSASLTKSPLFPPLLV